MIKTFIGGIILGVAAVTAALHLLPTVDQHREASIISVSQNGGNAEVFHVNVPMDRIMLGAEDNQNTIPPSLEWPQDLQLGDVRAELFKLRNSRDAVVGVASRLAASNDEIGDVIEWVLHLPARGSVYVTMQAQSDSNIRRVGELRAGTREFEKMFGQFSEQWVAATGDTENGQAGRIELATSFLSSVDVQSTAERKE